jgi:hypothetical protein
MGWIGHETNINTKNINKTWQEQVNKNITQERGKMWERAEANELWSDRERS